MALEVKWTFERFYIRTKYFQVTRQIILFPDLYPKSETHKNLHKAIVNKNNYLVYGINPKKNTIQIINFRGTKQKAKH